MEPSVLVLNRATAGRTASLVDAEDVSFAALLAVGMAVYGAGDVGVFFWCGLYPIGLAVVLGRACISTIRTRPKDILAPLFWFRAVSALYFGFGTSLVIFADQSVREVTFSFYNALEGEIAKAQLVVTSALLAVICVAKRVSGPYVPSTIDQIGLTFPPMLGTAAIGFVIAGCFVHYLFVLPYNWGQTPFTAGFFIIGDFRIIGLMLIFVLHWRTRGLLYYLALAIWLADGLFAVLTFSKHMMMLWYLTLGMPALLVRPTLLRASIVASGLFLTFTGVAAPFAWARNEVLQRNGAINVATFSERVEIVSAMPSTDELGTNSGSVLARLAYVTAQAFAVGSYDNGNPSDSLKNVAYVLVPRLLVPDKPIMTDVGRDFTEKVSQTRNNQTSPTLVVEGYYIGGWLMHLALMSLYGLWLGLLQRFCRFVIDKSKSVYFPALFFSMFMGMRPDGFLISDFFGNVPIFVALLITSFAVEQTGALLLGSGPVSGSGHPAEWGERFVKVVARQEEEPGREPGRDRKRT